MDDPKIALPIFGGIEVIHFQPDGLAPEGQALLDRFLALAPDALASVERHVYAYYRDFHQAVGGEDWLDEKMGVPAGAGEIWAHVHPILISVGREPKDGPWFVSIEARCDWEEEHGLQLVWDEALALVKAGPFDGHMTNAYAYDDDSLRDVVYSASHEKWTTRRQD